MSATSTAQQRACAFALAHGDALARARARALTGAGEAQAALDRIPHADPQDLCVLRDVLAICEELSALHASAAQQASAALVALQAQDGGFGAPELASDQRLHLTGAIGGALARSPWARPETLAAAGDFLAERFAPDLVQRFQWENLAACAHFFSNALHEASDEILQWCGRELERGFRARAFDALRTARVLVLCDAHALPGARLSREELLIGLLGLQAPDGSFGEAARPEGRVEPTLQGLRALCFLDGPDRPAAARGQARRSAC